MNIPEVKCGIISVSRDCFIISLSQNRRKAIVDAYTKKYGDLYEVPTVVENEKDMLKAVEEAKAAGCNALVVFLGNFGPETTVRSCTPLLPKKQAKTSSMAAAMLTAACSTVRIT